LRPLYPLIGFSHSLFHFLFQWSCFEFTRGSERYWFSSTGNTHNKMSCCSLQNNLQFQWEEYSFLQIDCDIETPKEFTKLRTATNTLLSPCERKRVLLISSLPFGLSINCSSRLSFQILWMELFSYPLEVTPINPATVGWIMMEKTYVIQC
jgi:hypothetical protein